jgi:hypothetical protein
MGHEVLMGRRTRLLWFHTVPKPAAACFLMYRIQASEPRRYSDMYDRVRPCSSYNIHGGARALANPKFALPDCIVSAEPRILAFIVRCRS